MELWGSPFPFFYTDLLPVALSDTDLLNFPFLSLLSISYPSSARNIISCRPSFTVVLSPRCRQFERGRRPRRTTQRALTRSSRLHIRRCRAWMSSFVRFSLSKSKAPSSSFHLGPFTSQVRDRKLADLQKDVLMWQA